MSKASYRAMRRIDLGGHLSYLYETEEDHRAMLTSFLRWGLERDEKVMYVAKAHAAETILSYLRDDGVDVESCLARGQLVVLACGEACSREGAFDAERMIALLSDERERGLADGYPALRVTSEMACALGRLSGLERLTEYEARLDEFLRGSQCVLMCQYDRRHSDPAALLEMLRHHPIVAVGTEVYDNFYHIPPAELVGGDLPAVAPSRWLENLAVHNRAQEEIRQRAQTLAALHDTALDLVTRRALPELLRAIVARAVDLLGASAGGIHLYRPATDDLEFVLRYNLELDFTAPVLKRGEGLSGKVLETGRPIAVADYSQWHGRAAQYEEANLTAVVAVPIFWGDQWLGVLNLLDDAPRTFSGADITLLERFTPLAAAALEQRRLLEVERAHWRRAETLRQAGAAVTETLSLDERLERILEQLHRVVPYDSASVQLLRDGHLEIVGGRGFPQPESVIGLKFAVRGHGLNMSVIEGRKPVILPDARAAYRHFREPPHDRIRSWLGVPLIVRDEVIGMLTVDSVEAGYFSEEHARLITPFAHQAAVAIENARLYEEARQRVAELEALQRTSLKLTSSLDPSAVLDTVAESALSLVGASNCHIYLYDETRGALTFGTALWEDGSQEAAVQRPRCDGLTSTVAREGRAIVINDALHHRFYASPRARKWGLQAIAGFPLKRAERLLGVCTIAFLKPHTFTEAEIRILGLLADQAAVAIDNAHLFQETEHLRVFNEGIVQSVAEAILMEDAEGMLTFANPAAEELLGYTGEELARRHWSALVPEGERERLRGELANRPQAVMRRYETALLSKQGRLIPVIVSARPLFADGRFVGVLSAFTDITERKRLEERIRGQDRLAAVGQLAAGIAHDFNNILTSMIGFAQLVNVRADVPKSVKEDVQQIMEGGQRAADLIRQILDFSRKSLISPQPMDLCPFLQETVKFLQHTIPESIHVVLETGPEGYWVHADAAQIQRALTNLALNGRDAMPGGGELQFRLSRWVLKPGDPRPFPSMEPGEWITVSVSDTGVGIAPELLPHIYEPFFTTKTPGEGTGLGLAQVYGIVKQHGGFIDVETEVGKGTTFVIFLPPLAMPPEEAREEAVEAMGHGQGETILVVEDEAHVLGVSKAMLERLGYAVLTATTGLQALEVYGRHREEIALVLADMVMPQMGGVELFQKLRVQNPAVRLVVMTGYPLEEQSQQLLAQGIVDWIPKPLDLAGLAQVVGQALTSRHAQSSEN